MERRKDTFFRKNRSRMIFMSESPSRYEKLRNSPYWDALSQEEKDTIESLACGVWIQGNELKKLKVRMKSQDD